MSNMDPSIRFLMKPGGLMKKILVISWVIKGKKMKLVASIPLHIISGIWECSP
jgi:hypothetical protein